MSMGKYREMGRERIGRYAQETRQLACGEAVRVTANEQAKDLKPCALAESSEGAEAQFCSHKSRLMEAKSDVKPDFISMLLELPFDWRLSRCHDRRMKLDDAAAHLEALGNPTRLKIYRALVRAGDAGMPVGRLQDKLKIAPSTLSHHIKTLVTAGLISQVREATTLTCHANYDVMRGLVDFLVAECCADAAECKDTSAAA
jgi:DNA-binding transcriptional ArsR family regulator